MTIGKKLVGAFAAMLAMTLIPGAISYRAIQGLSADVSRAVNVTSRRQFLAGEIGAATSEMEGQERAIALSLILQQQEQSARHQRQFENAAARLDKALSEFRGLLEASESHATMDSVARKSAPVLEAHREFLRLLAAQQIDAALRSFDQVLLPRVVDISSLGRALADQQGRELTAVSDQAAARAVRSRWVMSALLACVLATGGVVLWVVRQANAGLRRLAMRLEDGAGQVADAASQVSSSSQALAQGASEQASTLEQTTNSTEQVTSITRANAEKSRSMAGLMRESESLVGQANQTLNEMVGSMHEITASADKISRIIKVIDEIAFQTNILALNAAVEAARAGDAGLGFAVVADEVRNLAQRSAEAAKNTAGLIEESISKSNDGNGKLGEVANAIRAITQNSERVTVLVEEVSQGREEQVRSIEQISTAVAQIGQVTQVTASSAEQSASAGLELSRQADLLNDVVSEFRALVG
jgi:methyl-accepting chemotaxis protein